LFLKDKDIGDVVKIMLL